MRSAVLLTVCVGIGACGIEPGGVADTDVEMQQSALTSGLTKINCGGPAVSPFVADVDSTGGTSKTRANTIDLRGVVNPAPAAVYQTQRYGNFTYTLPGFAANSVNKVRLHFAETHWTAPKQRLFNVSINGTMVLMGFDTFVAAGGANRALVEEFVLKADSTGKYTIVFTTLTDAAFVSGIEVVAPPPNKTNSPEVITACARPVHASLPVGATNATMGATTVIPVIWGSGVSMPAASMTNFGNAVGGGVWLNWIQAEYGAGPATFTATPVTITPKNTSKTLADLDIGSELAAQISQGNLAPNDLSKTEAFLYMVYFPSNVTLKRTDGTQSCVNFCGFHNSVISTLSGKHIIFAALPDASVCPNNCNEFTTFSLVDNMTVFASHELVEALTDPYSTGWQDLSQAGTCGTEIGDFCVGRTMLTGNTSGSSTAMVQQIYSNASASCEQSTPGSPLDFTGFGFGSSMAISGIQDPSGGVPQISFFGIDTIDGSLLFDDTPFAINNQTFFTNWEKESVPLWGDFTGDGLADIALTGITGWSTIPLAAGGGAGTVTNMGITKTNSPAGLADGSNFPALVATTEWSPPPIVGDFNGDGRSDIAKIGPADANGNILSTIPIAYGTGDKVSAGSGLFWSSNRADGGLAAKWLGSESHVVAGDFNRDGRTDIALVGGVDSTNTAWGSIYVALSKGDGSFAPLVARSVFTDRASTTSSTFTKMAASDFYVQTVVGDYNGDGLMDIALIGAQLTVWNTIPIAMGKPDGNFFIMNLEGGGDNKTLANAAAQTPMKIVSGDFNGDGLWDIALVGPASWTSPMLGFGTTTLGQFKAVSSTNLADFMTLANDPSSMVLSAQLDLYRQL